jgi:hypothetical protein
MSVRDRFDRDTLNALQSIARSLERIADSMEKMERIIIKNQLILVKTKKTWELRGYGNDF